MPTQRIKREPSCKEAILFLFFCAYLIFYPATAPAREDDDTAKRQAKTSDALFPLPAQLATDITEEDLLSALKAKGIREIPRLRRVHRVLEPARS